MEDEKKKKRNKKKKNKQSKSTEGVGGAGDLDSGEPASCLDDDHVSNGQDDRVDGHVQVSDAHYGSDVQNLNVDLNGHLLNGTVSLDFFSPLGLLVLVSYMHMCIYICE